MLTPLDGYIIQTRINRKTLYFSDIMELGAGVTEVNVTGLFPGTEYDIQVVSMNQAGRTPSESTTFSTIPDGNLALCMNVLHLKESVLAVYNLA